MRKINILYIINKLAIGGAERQLVELLKGLDKSRFNPLLVCLERGGGFTEDVKALKIPIYYIERKWRWDPLVVWKLREFIKKNKINIIHTYLSLASIYGAIVGKLTKTPIVNSSIRKASSFGGYYRNFLVKLSCKLSNIIISNSIAGVNYFFNKKHNKIKVIYNGVDFSRFKISKNKYQIKKELGLSNFENIVSMVSRIEEGKGHLTLISSAKIILKYYPKTCFLIVGDGSLRPQLENFVHQQNLQKNILFLGFRKDIPEIFSISDVAVNCSDSEGISNAIIEAMAIGVPVVATDIGGNREIIINGETGFLIPPGSCELLSKAIIKLFKNKKFASQIAMNGKQLVKEEFNFEKMVKDTEELYQQLLVNIP